ncbi:MAG: LysR family transcriptional regulator [Gammaproteobacteria bacterium]|nr:LysR family transcriptional regulator [Gammaproteobacteria bacterium]
MSIKRYRIPSSSALQAFESAARHCNFSRAAEELHTSQSAISRHISNLENRFNTLLFDRYQKRNLTLSHQGDLLYRAVVSGFGNIQAAIDNISGTSSLDQLTIACTHEISHLYLLPRFDDLQQAIGRDKPIRIMTYEYDTMESSLDSRIDVVIRYDVSRVDPADRVRIVSEAVRPVAAPAFIECHRVLLDDEISAWQALPFLDLSKHNYVWATWKDWFQAKGCADFAPDFTFFSNYVYLLEAAAAGKGLALGWRGLIERHLHNGVLSAVVNDYVTFDRAIYAILTARGRNKPLAQQFLDCIGYKKSKAE